MECNYLSFAGYLLLAFKSTYVFCIPQTQLAIANHPHERSPLSPTPGDVDPVDNIPPPVLESHLIENSPQSPVQEIPVSEMNPQAPVLWSSQTTESQQSPTENRVDDNHPSLSQVEDTPPGLVPVPENPGNLTWLQLPAATKHLHPITATVWFQLD